MPEFETSTGDEPAGAPPVPAGPGRAWSDVHEVAPITMPGGVVTEETAQHAAIYDCSRPRGSWSQIWPSLRHLD